MNARALLASPLIVLLVAATRLLIVSGYNSETAVTILRLGGPTDTALGVLIPMLPLVLPTLTVVFLAFRNWRAAVVAAVCSLLVAVPLPDAPTLTKAFDNGMALFRWYSLGAVDMTCSIRGVSGVCATARPAVEWFPGGPIPALRPSRLDLYPRAHSLGQLWDHRALTIAVLITLVLGATRLRVDFDTGDVTKGRQAGLRVTGLLTGVLAGMALAVPVAILVAVGSYIYPIPPDRSWVADLHRMWLPSERVTLQNGKEMVAYPLGVKDNWAVLLVDKGRTIEYVRPTAIVSRTTCSLDAGTAPPPPYWGSTTYVSAGYVPCYRRATQPRKATSRRAPTGSPLRPFPSEPK